MPAACKISNTVGAAIACPSRASSPWILRCPVGAGFVPAVVVLDRPGGAGDEPGVGGSSPPVSALSMRRCAARVLR